MLASLFLIHYNNIHAFSYFICIYLPIVPLYVCECVLMCPPNVDVKEKFWEVGSLLQPQVSQKLNSDHCSWTWQLAPLWVEQLNWSNRHGFDIWDLCWFSIFHNLRVNSMTERKISLHSPSHNRLPDRQNSLQSVILLTLCPSVISTHQCDTLS